MIRLNLRVIVARQRATFERWFGGLFGDGPLVVVRHYPQFAGDPLQLVCLLSTIRVVSFCPSLIVRSKTYATPMLVVRETTTCTYWC